MRYLKIASAKNPDTDYIELNDLKGFICTSFQTLGISRKIDTLVIKNRQFSVQNKPSFKKYSLVVDILAKYARYEQKYRELITFFDRNKKCGIRLYFRPYDGMELRYCLCDIESTSKISKMQPISIVLSQNSFWLGEERKAKTSTSIEENDNIFAFKDDDGYYSASFSEDEKLLNYYCVAFSGKTEALATIINNSYNEVPLNIRILGGCVNPVVSLYKKGEGTPIKQIEIVGNISNGDYVEVNSTILENGVWYVKPSTGDKIDYSYYVNNMLGSPYFYIDNGEYEMRCLADGDCSVEAYWQEEYSE